MNLKRMLSSVAVILAVMIAGVMVSVGMAAGGTGPGDALLPTGAEMTAAPGSQIWFQFDESGSGLPVTAALDANEQEGIHFRVYTPEAITMWLRGDELKAVGASSRTPEHDQMWVGRFQTAGTYYIVVENTSAGAIGFRLNVSGDGVTTVVVRTPTATPLPNPFKTTAPVTQLQGEGKIVFQESSGGNIYTVNAGGSNLQRVTFGLDPALSPDGTRIAFARQGPIPGVYVSNADGSDERRLFGGTQVRSPSWASDHELVFSSVTSVRGSAPICFFGRCFGGDDETRWGLFHYDLNENTMHDVITPKTGGTVPSVNRVLGEIAFLNPEKGLMLTTLDDKAEPRLINDDLSINTPVMSPDGSRLTYMVNQPPSWQVVVAVWDGTNPTLMTRNDPLSFEHPNNVAPTFSPDGQEILFLSNRNGKWEFFVVKADGTNERQVLKNVTDAIEIRYEYSAERVAMWGK